MSQVNLCTICAGLPGPLCKTDPEILDANIKNEAAAKRVKLSKKR